MKCYRLVLCSLPDTGSMKNENTDPLLSAAQTPPPERSSDIDSTAPAVLLLPPLMALPERERERERETFTRY